MDYRNYVTLLKSVIEGDWETAETILNDDKDALKVGISNNSKTVLHVAVGLGTAKANHIVKKLLEDFINSPEELESMVDEEGSTALHEAAIVGNLDAARSLVEKNANLTLQPDMRDNLPIYKAALYGHKELLLYLRSITPERAFNDISGYRILDRYITAGFYDVALDLVKRDCELAKMHPLSHPKLAKMEPPISLSLLEVLAKNPSAFYSGSKLKFWQRLIYHCVPLNSNNLASLLSCCKRLGDIENPSNGNATSTPCSCQVGRWLQLFRAVRWQIFWEFLGKLVPSIKRIQDAKLIHHQVLQLLKCLCEEANGMDYRSFVRTIGRASRVAAENGIYEIVEQILETYPFVIWFTDGNNYGPLETAVLHRHENVFNLIYQMSEYKYFVTQVSDNQKNSTLHLVARLAPPHRLIRIPGAALQMQRELQWFKEVEKLVKPSFKERRNNRDKTPEMIFTEEHKDMVKEGEAWMKGMANSCIVAAALLATVGFAAAITVPGGNNGSNGFPAFSNEKIFLVFLVSNAISLFSSVAAVIMFLSILTARYAEKDFLYALPKRLIFGLVTLFLSITAMMVAFSSAIWIMLEHKKSWILILVGASACLPVTLFVTLQFPLLFRVIVSTYGPSIFRKQRERLLH